jgi:hypothetical protein
MTTDNDLVTAFSGRSMDAAMAHSILIANGIDAYVIGEVMGAVAPWYGSPGGSGSVRVQVNQRDLETAKQILSENAYN